MEPELVKTIKPPPRRARGPARQPERRRIEPLSLKEGLNVHRPAVYSTFHAYGRIRQVAGPCEEFLRSASTPLNAFHLLKAPRISVVARAQQVHRHRDLWHPAGATCPM